VPPDEVIPLIDAGPRVIGRQTETLSTAFDGALEPLRALRTPPDEVAQAVKIAEEGVARNILALNDVLREAYDADRAFWQRLGGSGSFAPASPRAEAWAKGTGDALRALEERLASSTTMANSREQVLKARADALTEQQRQAHDRLAAFAARTAWLPIGLELWTRLYPIIAGALAITVLVRLQRVLVLRQRIGDDHLDEMAPSWIIAPPGAPGRWWALILVAIPLVASAHAALTALRDVALFTTPVGERHLAAMVLYGLVYLAILVAGTAQLRAVLIGSSPAGAAPAGSSTLARQDPEERLV
jgi:hypothetical protein